MVDSVSFSISVMFMKVPFLIPTQGEPACSCTFSTKNWAIYWGQGTLKEALTLKTSFYSDKRYFGV